MPPPPNTKPENVLKRAQELIGVGQSQAALALLHEHVTSKRTRNNPIASIEPVMLLFVELCVDLRKGKAAKDGLYSYKNTAQNTNVQTIELVLRKFIELAEAKVTDAQAKAESIQSSQEPSAATASIDDLEASETPESILLSTVSGEQSKDRVDRAVVTPWLKLLWETYRSVLDILKNNARLEVMYSTVAQQAFAFCKNYERRTEFRRLCELLRNHLQNAAKYQSQIHAINLSDPDTLQRHLDTRFQQLKIATDLALWQEAFRSIEDIHMLLNLSRRGAKNVQMATYFEQLSRIFLKSDNYLFHAASYNRYYNLLRASSHAIATGQGNKKDYPTVTEADLTKGASFVVLSALSIPVISTSRSRGALVDVDESRKVKAQRLTNLLGLNTPPSRALLFKEIASKGLLKRARPEIRELYNILEVDFSPLLVCKKISPILTQIGADPEMSTYVAPLQQVILTRLFQQLSQVYESVKLDFVMGLAQFPEPFQVDSATIEKFIMNGDKKGDLAIRINHASGTLTFDSDVFSSAKAVNQGSAAGSAESESGSVQQLQKTPSDIVRSSLTRLAKTLFTTCQYVDPTYNEDQRKARAAALQRAEVGANKEHLDTLARRETIEKKKQAASSAAAQREKEQATIRRIRQQEQQQAEAQRLETEQREREQKRIREQQERVKREEVEKQLKELKEGVKNIDLEGVNIDDLDTQAVRLLKLQALEKEKTELGERLRAAGKRIDYMERAMRKAELAKLPADYEAQCKADLAEYEETKTRTLEQAKEQHAADVALKRRLSRLVGPYESFRNDVREQRAAEFEKRRKTAQRELEQKKQQRIREFRQRKEREQAEREERERQEREEEARREREAEEAAAKEEERKRKQAEIRARQEEDRKKNDEIAAKQAQREAEAEARRSTRSGASGPSRSFGFSRERDESPADTASAPSSRGPPRIGGAGGGWREREAARRAAETSGEAPPAPSRAQAPPAEASPTPAPAQPARSGYVPPHLRNRTGGASAGGEAMPDSFRSGSGRGRDESGPRGGAGSGRFERDRNASPANGAAGGRDMGGRSFSGRGDATERSDSPAQPAPQEGAQTGGKYRPGAFRQARQG